MQQSLFKKPTSRPRRTDLPLQVVTVPQLSTLLSKMLQVEIKRDGGTAAAARIGLKRPTLYDRVKDPSTMSVRELARLCEAFRVTLRMSIVAERDAE